ncbi:MAG: tetratricopeptide repeat protein [bacterium]|nr:tetratricopeptide repeat protein [bacterium]
MSRPGFVVAILNVFLLLGSHAFASGLPSDLIDEGVRLHGEGKYEEAVRSFNAALEQNKDNDLALLELSNTYAAMSKYDLCIETAKHGVELGTEVEGQLYSSLGFCYLSDGSTGRAIRTFKKGLAKHPNEVSLNYNLAVALEEDSRNEDAIKHAMRAIEGKPTDSAPYFLLGQLFAEEGDRAAAILSFMRFVTLEPNTRRTSQASNEVFMGFTNAGTAGPAGALKLASASHEDLLEALEVSRQRAASATQQEEEQAKGEPRISIDALTRFVTTNGELADEDLENVFVWKYLVRVPLMMQQDEVFESFAYVLAARAGIVGAYDWLEQHPKEINRLNRTHYK